MWGYKKLLRFFYLVIYIFVICGISACSSCESEKEVCDGIDNDGDGKIDEDAVDATTFFADADDDTYGDSLTSVTDCESPIGYVKNDDDCDDTDATIGAPHQYGSCDTISLFDFSSWSLYQTSVSAGELTLGTDGSGNYYEEGYAETADFIDKNLLSGKLLRLDATRINSLVDGDFQDVSSSATTKFDGWWWSSGANDDVTFIDAVSGNRSLKLFYPDSGSTIEQAFRVGTGEDYTVTFSIDGANLYHDVWSNTYQNLSFILRYQDGTSNLNVYHPYDLTTKTAKKLFTINNHLDSRTETGTSAFRIHTADYDTHEIKDYKGDSYTTYSFCDSATGADCSGNITHASLAMSVGSDGLDSSYSCTDSSIDCSVTLDNVFVDRENQVEIELINSGGEVVQSSTLDKGMQIVELAEDVNIRIYLRSYKETESPSVSGGEILSGMGVTLNAGTQKLAISEPRLGYSGGIPPGSEFSDESLSEITTKCLDNFNSDSETDCYQYLVANGISRNRIWAASGVVATWNETSMDYDFSLDDTFMFYFSDRWNKAVDSGYTPQTFILRESQTLYYSDVDVRNEYCTKYVTDTSNDCCYNSDGVYRSSNLACSVDNFPDFTGTRSSEEQSRYLLGKVAAFFATILNGSDYTNNNGITVNLPNVDMYELSAEPDGAGKLEAGSYDLGWKEDVGQTELLEIYNEIANATSTARSDAGLDFRIAIPSILGNSMIFDTYYLDEALDTLDYSYFTEVNFHPYIFGDEWIMPELAFNKWDEVEEILSNKCSTVTGSCWNDYPIHFTEWGDTHAVFDPDCEDGEVYWKRDWGSEAYAKRSTRETITFMNLPIESIYRYGIFTNEWDSWVRECWHTEPLANHHIMERVAGDGYLDCIDDMSRAGCEDTDGDSLPDYNSDAVYDATTYKPSSAGIAFMTLARNISDASPYKSEIKLDDGDSKPFNEHYYSALFLGSDANYYLGLWWYRDYIYATNSDYMNYASGIKDNGFEETRVHNVTLNDFGLSISSAQVIYLDGEENESITIEEDDDGNQILMGVEFGEMPVVVRLVTD